MVVWGGPAIKRDVNLARAFAKGGDNVLFVLCEMAADITPQYSAAGNSLSNAYKWIKVFQNLVQNFIINKTKKEIADDDKLNQQALQMLFIENPDYNICILLFPRLQEVKPEVCCNRWLVIIFVI
jgi:hypothetical protein